MSTEVSTDSKDNRSAHVVRETNETRVSVTLRLDGTGQHSIDTGIGFLDHMLAQVALHGLFDLEIEAKGDLHVDAHHTVEDVALVFGDAFNQALGNRKGIVRMASMTAPMDDSLATVTVDLSGRPYTIISAGWSSPAIGELPTSLIGHFFESFAIQARCNLHALVHYGKDDHHQAEALFKAFARALDAATLLDPRRTGAIPSTKGVV